jgi:hypothetical protein
MRLIDVRKTAIEPAMVLLPERMDTPEALVMMLAIGLQESRFLHRVQMGNGPARGFWQFEEWGGVRGVIQHGASRTHIPTVCQACGVYPRSQENIYRNLATNDVLAAAFARLLLFTDPNPLPELGEVNEAWEYYIRNWRPGKPHRQTWDTLYSTALKEVRS